MKRAIAWLLLAIALMLSSGCMGKETIYSLSPSDTDTSYFLENLVNRSELYEDDVCYNVTPPEISERHTFEVYKFNKSGASYLFYQDEVYMLGECFGGHGAVSFAVEDINADGFQELYFTFSWGSGIHRGCAGYFDSVRKEVIVFEYADAGNDLLFVAEDSGLMLYRAEIQDYQSYVDMKLKAKEVVGEITCKNDEIVLDIYA